MRVSYRILVCIVAVTLVTSTTAWSEDLPVAAPAAQANTATAAVDPLLQVLVTKGVLTSDEAKSLGGTPAEQRAKLLGLLRQKGILSAADYQELTTPSASAQVAPNLVASTTPIVPVGLAQATPAPVAAPPPPPGPSVVPAIAPLRVSPVDPPVKDGLNAAFKMGPVKMTPYGFVKATAAHDTSSPNGDDFPFVGLFLTTPQTFDTGPTKDPEFHLKARSTRIGTNLEWPDMSSKIALTGRIEGDYEGNFSEVDNRDVSSIRSNAFQLRLAWARLDYAASDHTDLYFEGGQDWTLFGSSVLPPILETTFLGAFYGVIYERSPQFQFGMVEKLGGSHNFKIAPTFAIMMPSSGQILKLGSEGLAGQLGEGEREGADSGRPEIEGRLALQFQLDPAKGVAPAQLLISGFQGRRTSIVPNSSFISSTGVCEITASYCAAFPNGFTASSTMYGGQFGFQLPTRWFTLIGSMYRGGDLRFFFGGQVNSFATDTGGLTNIEPFSTTGAAGFSTLDGGPLAAAGGAVLGCQGTFNTVTGTCSGSIVVAPQRPIRSFGGFMSLGLPLSRWFEANPKGRNAGWTLFATVGKDQVVNRDLNNVNFSPEANTLSPLPLAMGKFLALTLNYKLNPYVQFSLEQSIYATRIEDGLPLYNIAGTPSNEWQDHRTEFGPVFTF
jgi:hypothetical protein